jgi:quinol monooxygenase YgiN
MKTLMVRYKTAETHGDENEALVRAVFEELRSRAPGGIRYASYRLADGVTFVHIATLETPDENPLVALPAFKAFQKELKDRCVEQPVVTEVSVVGSYGLVA